MKTTWIVYQVDGGGNAHAILARPFDLEAEAYQVMRNASIKWPAERFRVVERTERTIWEQPSGGRYPEHVAGSVSE
jgi:hypothetical protein